MADSLKDYLLTIRVPIKAVDDVDARMVAEKITLLGARLPKKETGRIVKLQEIVPKAPPRSVDISPVLKY